MRRYFIVAVIFVLFIGMLVGLVLPNVNAGASISVDGPRVIYWGNTPVFDITVSGEEGEAVRLAPWLVPLSGDDSYVFSSDSDTWHVKATVSDRFYKDKDFAYFVIARSTLPKGDPILPLVYEQIQMHSSEHELVSFWRPIAKRVVLKKVPGDILTDIFQSHSVYTQGDVVYENSSGNLTLNNATVTIYNQSTFDLVFSFDIFVKTKRYVNYNAPKYKLYPEGWVSLDIGNSLYEEAYKIAQKYGKGTKQVDIGYVTIFDKYQYPLKVTLKVCQNGDCKLDSYGEPVRTWCGSVKSGLLDFLADNNTKFVAAPIGEKVLIVYDGINYKCVTTDAPATIRNGRTLVPMRFFLEALGAKLWWVPKDKKVVVVIPQKPDETDSYRYWESVTKIEMWIGYARARVNGSVYDMPSDVPPQIIYSRTYVPLRFIGEMTGWKADWDGDGRVAVIHR